MTRVAQLVFVLAGWLASSVLGEQPAKEARPAGIGDPGQLVSLSFESSPGSSAVVVLHGSEPRRQLVVTGNYASGQKRDLTQSVGYTIEPENVAAAGDARAAGEVSLFNNVRRRQFGPGR